MEYLLIILVTAALTAWAVLWRCSRVFGRQVPDFFRDLFRLDLERLPVNDRHINRAYQALMRRSGQRGPAGLKQTRRHMVVLTPEEDYAYIKAFGMDDFEGQLLTFLRGFAADNADWHASSSTEPTSIHFKLDKTRKRLRPKLADPARGVTSVLTPGTTEQVTDVVASPHVPEQPLNDVHAPGASLSLQATQAMAPTHSQEPPVAVAPRTTVFADVGPISAHFSYQDTVMELLIGDGELTVGRTDDNDIVMKHDHVSARQLIVWGENGQWKVRQAPEALNATRLNGHELQGTAALNNGDQIKVGLSANLVFHC